MSLNVVECVECRWCVWSFRLSSPLQLPHLKFLFVCFECTADRVDQSLGHDRIRTFRLSNRDHLTDDRTRRGRNQAIESHIQIHKCLKESLLSDTLYCTVTHAHTDQHPCTAAQLSFVLIPHSWYAVPPHIHLSIENMLMRSMLCP